MTRVTRYRNIGSDSARWLYFEPRPGDVIVSTPPKTGTTLTQRLVALAVFASPELPASMDKVSPWFDQHHRSDDEAFSIVEAMTHRRFLKTHTPLDGIPAWDDVTYITTARDPRELFMSWEAQLSNMDMDAVRAAFEEGVGLGAVSDLVRPPVETFAGRFDEWLDTDDLNQFCLARNLHQMQIASKRSSQPNVFCFHFEDLKADTRASLALVAEAIGAQLTSDQLDELAPHATFDTMKQNAAELAPNTKGIFADSQKFFRGGSSNSWSDVLTTEQVERYEARAASLVDAETLRWIHQA